MQGETTGRKMMPKNFCNMIRAKLEPYEYIEEHPTVNCQGTLENRSQFLQIQTMTMLLREIMKAVMTVMIMKENKEVN